MVFWQLSWRLSTHHSHLFTYIKGRGTAECLRSFLSELGSGKGLAVFIDLGEAFKLACPEAILATLASRSVGGHLLGWLKSFFNDREATLRFQGHMPSAHQHTNANPQGSILSPTLFNALVECLLHIDLSPGTQLPCYADNITLVIYCGPYHTEVQRALSKLHQG